MATAVRRRPACSRVLVDIHSGYEHASAAKMVDRVDTVLTLQPFQRRFLRSALAPGIRTAALSLPRGNGKSTLVAWLGARALTPGDRLFVEGAESAHCGGVYRAGAADHV